MLRFAQKRKHSSHSQKSLGFPGAGIAADTLGPNSVEELAKSLPEVVSVVDAGWWVVLWSAVGGDWPFDKVACDLPRPDRPDCLARRSSPLRSHTSLRAGYRRCSGGSQSFSLYSSAQ